ncbi:MAG: dTDP-4-dehydrorhamnose 3,5-epimerase [Pseudomonadota bacterium]|nr:dTDP-4-dehydrorhamnose 3,5-epimerase [Pseudomonadota bacterium]
MHVEKLAIPDVKLISTDRFVDNRGFFSEIFSQRDFESAGISFKPLQENYSFSSSISTIRGLHWQSPPYAQSKLVNVLQGRIFDVAVDLRLNSPWFGQHITAELSANHSQRLFIPSGFAHGFCSLDKDTAVLYSVDSFYAKECEAGIKWNDPDLDINWPITEKEAVISDKDNELPKLSDCKLSFVYNEQEK